VSQTEAAGSAVIQNELLTRAGYGASGFSNSAILRATLRIVALDSECGGWY
jgi:hypothetical protein